MGVRPVTSIAQPNSIIYDSCKWEYSSDGITWYSLGVARGVKFTENMEISKIQTDNGPDIAEHIGDHTCMISANLLEFYLPRIQALRGGIDSLTVDSAVATTDTDIYTTGQYAKSDIIWLQNQGSSSTLPAISKVKSVSTGNACTTYTATDDYFVITSTDDGNKRGIAIVPTAMGGDYKDTEALKIKYAYGQIANRHMTTGGFTSIGALWHRLTNATVIGGVTKYRYITIYSGRISKGLDMAFKSANESDSVLESPFEITAKVDTSRTSGDQLFAIDDEAGVA